MGVLKTQKGKTEEKKTLRGSLGSSHVGIPNSALLSMCESGGMEPPPPGDTGTLGSRILERQPSVQPRPQAQIPQAEAEADRLSATVFSGTPEGVKADMGRRLGADFSGVRFHMDSAAAQMADAIGAKAYTAGSDVYFGTGGFDAAIAAHELVHTVQQGAVDSGAATLSTPLGGIQMVPDPKRWKIGQHQRMDEEEENPPPLPPRYSEENPPPLPPRYSEQNPPPLPPRYSEENPPPLPPRYSEENPPPLPPRNTQWQKAAKPTGARKMSALGAARQPAEPEAKGLSGWFRKHFSSKKKKEKDDEESFSISTPGSAAFSRPAPSQAQPAAQGQSQQGSGGAGDTMKQVAEGFHKEAQVFQESPALSEKEQAFSGEGTSPYEKLVQAFRQMELVKQGISPDPESYDRLYESCAAAEIAAEYVKSHPKEVPWRQRSSALRLAAQVSATAKGRTKVLEGCREDQIQSGLWIYHTQGSREEEVSAESAAKFDSMTDTELKDYNALREQRGQKAQSMDLYKLNALKVQTQKLSDYAASVAGSAEKYRDILDRISRKEPLKEGELATLRRALGFAEYLQAVLQRCRNRQADMTANAKVYEAESKRVKDLPKDDKARQKFEWESADRRNQADTISEFVNYGILPCGCALWPVLEAGLGMPVTVSPSSQNQDLLLKSTMPSVLRAKIQEAEALEALDPKKAAQPGKEPSALEKFQATIRDQAQPGMSQLKPEQVKLLMDSMDETENVHQARMVAEKLEWETTQRLAGAFPKEKGKDGGKKPGVEVQKPGGGTIVQAPADVIRDYTASSASFRALANGTSSDEGAKMKQEAMDKLLEKMAAGHTAPRVTYRYMAYDDKAQCPYGAAQGNAIRVGDLVTDPNFVSTSAGKQFIQGKEATTLNPAQVNMVIYGSSGVPIATKEGSYSNGAQMQPQKSRDTRLLGESAGKVRGAGQAEVLYPRNTVFKVLAIEKKEEGGRVIYKVALSEVQGDQASGPAKNAYSGA